MYTKAIICTMNGNLTGNLSHTNTTIYLQNDQTIANQEIESILIGIFLYIIVFLWVGTCLLLKASECGSNHYDQNVKTSIEDNSKDDLSGNLSLLQNRRESLGHIYGNKLSDESQP